MANKGYKAFIVEGEVREPQIINNISKIFFLHENFKVITLPAGKNIYVLWKQLKDDDFDTDIIEILREGSDEIRNQLIGVSRDDFSEVYLFFDYDVHQNNLKNSVDEDVICQMLESFDNETDNGKLYISYPMVEALRDYEPGKCGNGKDCFVKIQDICNYKNTSSVRSYNPQFKDYDIEAWKNIIGVFAMKVSCLYEMSDVMGYEQYSDKVTPADIYAVEARKTKLERVFVLSAFPEFLLDYFGVKLWKTSVRQRKNLRESHCCLDNIF